MLYYEILAGHPEMQTALIFKEQKMTYGQLRESIERRANFLQAKGLQKGDRVGLLSKNCADFVISYFAVIRAGGVVVPFNFQLAPREIAYIVKDAGINLMIARQKIDLTEALQEIDYAGLVQFDFVEMEEPIEH